MPNGDKLKTLHKSLTERYKDFTIDYDTFHADMQDTAKLRQLHTSLQEREPDFTIDYETFASDMGIKEEFEPIDLELGEEERGALIQGMAEEEPVREGATTLIPEEKPSVGRAIYESLARGSAALGRGISRIPAFIYNVAAMPQNVIGEVLNIQKLKVKTPDWLMDNPVAKYYDKQVEAWNASDERYDNLITGYLKNGEIGNALGLLAANTAETLPLMIGLYMGGFAGAGATQTLTGMTLYAGAEKTKEIEDVDLPEYMKTFNAITTGLAEGAFETIGTVQIAKLGKEVFKKAGKEEGERILKEGFETTFKRAFKKMYGTAAPVAEGLEEAATTFTQNLTDRYTGVDPERNPMEGIGDSFLIGMTAAGAMTAPIRVAAKIKEVKAEKPVEEEIKPPEPVKEPSKEVIPEKKVEVPPKEEKPLEEPKKIEKPKPFTEEELMAFEPTGRIQKTVTGADEVLKSIEEARIKIKKGEEAEIGALTTQGTKDILGEVPGKIKTEKELDEYKTIATKVKRVAQGEIDKRAKVEVPEKPVEGFELGEKRYETKEELFKDLERFEDLKALPETMDMPTIKAIEEFEQLKLKEEKEYAERIRKEAEEAGRKEKVESEEERRLRLRDIEKDGLEAKPPEEKIPVEERVSEAEIVKQKAEEKQFLKDVEKFKSLGAAVKGFEKKDIFDWLGEKEKMAIGAVKDKAAKDKIKIEYAKKKADIEKVFKKSKIKGKRLKGINIRKDIVKLFINENRSILSRVHGRVVPALLKRVNEVKTFRTLERILDYMDKVVTDQKTKEEFVAKQKSIEYIEKHVEKKAHLQKGIKRDKSKYPDSETFYNMTKRIGKIKEIINVENPEELSGRLEVLERELENPKLTPEQIENISEEIQNLGFAGLYDMPVEQVRAKELELKEIVKTATKEGIADREARIEKDVEEIDWWVDILARKKFKKGKVSEIEELKMTPEEQVRVKKKTRGMIEATFIDNLATVLDKLSKYDPERGKLFINQLANRIMPRVRKSRENYEAGLEEAWMDIQEAQKRIFKVAGKALRKKLKNNAVAEGAPNEPLMNKIKNILGIEERIVVEEVKYQDVESGKERNIYLNQNIALKKWLELKDPTMDNTFFSEAIIGRDGRMRGMGYTESTVKAIEDYLTPEMKEYGEWLIGEFYPKLYKRFNPTYKRMNGTDMPFNEFYTNITRESGARDASIEEVIAGETIMGTVNNGHLINRVGSTLPLRYVDVNRSLLSYIGKMELYSSWAETIKYMQKVFRNPKVRASITQWHKTDYLKVMDHLIEDLQGKHQRREMTYNAINGIRRRFIIGSLAWKPTIFIKQLLSQPAFIVNLGARGYVKSLGKFMADPKAAYDMVMKNPTMRARMEKGGWDRDTALAMAKNFRKMGQTKDWVHQFMTLVKWGDITPILISYPEVYRSEYKKAIEKGFSEERAKEVAQFKASDNTLMWQQSGLREDLSPMQAGNPYMKLFSMYMTAPLQYHRQATGALRHIYGDVKKGNLKTTAGRKLIKDHVKRFVIAHVVLPSMFTWGLNGFEWDEKDQLRTLIFGNMNNLPFIGDILDFAADKIQGLPFDYAPTPVGTTIRYGEKTFRSIHKMVKEIIDNDLDLEEVIDVAEKSADVISLLAGLPLTGVKNSWKGIWDVTRGETDDVWDSIRRILGWTEYDLREKEEKEKVPKPNR